MRYGENTLIRRINLSDYYLTVHWRKRSKEFREKYPKCQKCGATSGLHVHHKRYRFFRERNGDLLVVCEKCHLRDIHHQLEEMDMLDFNHQKNRGDRLNFLIDEALENRIEKPRDYLGGSSIGHECARALQYEFFNVPKDCPFNGQTLRTFAIGHVIEDLAADWLRSAGLDLRVRDKDGKQFGFTTANGKISGHVDGVIVGGPLELGPYPRLWECKSASGKKWREFEKNKVKKTNWTYYIQVQTYMVYMDLAENPALWTCVNKDDSSLYHENIEFDASVAQEASDRAVRILQACLAGELLPREYPSADFYQCKWCSWGDRCWHG
jgi:hypothetical protein